MRTKIAVTTLLVTGAGAAAAGGAALALARPQSLANLPIGLPSISYPLQGVRIV
jgi:hypothetical protein